MCLLTQLADAGIILLADLIFLLSLLVVDDGNQVVHGIYLYQKGIPQSHLCHQWSLVTFPWPNFWQ